MKPVILIPGFGGSVLVKKGQERYRPYPLAKEILDNRWVNMTALTSPPSKRWREDMHYKVLMNDKHRVIGFDDIPKDIVPYDIGGTQGIRDLVPEFFYLNNKYKHRLNSAFYYRYYHDICSALHKEGYVDNVNLRGLPYDFRLVLDPKYRETMFEYFGKVIEQSVRLSGEKAVVVSHSLGGIMFKWFLSEFPYFQNMVETWVSISTPFGGSHYSLRAAFCGDHYIPFFKSCILDELARNTGLIVCFPNELSYDRNETLATIGDVDISIRSYEEHANAGMIQFQIYRDLYLPYFNLIQQPISVATHAVISLSDNSTTGKFRTRVLGEQPNEITMVCGDNIVGENSLRSFEKIIYQRNMKELVLRGESDHTSPLLNKQVIDLILNYAKSRPRC